MKIARTYLLTFLIILLMCISGCFEHTTVGSTSESMMPTNEPSTTNREETSMVTTVPGSIATMPPETTIGTVPPMVTEPPATTLPTESPTTAPPTRPPETTAPTTEPTEPEPTWPNLDDEDFVRILDFVPNARQELRYGTANNFTGQVIYDFQDAYLRFGTVKKLAKVAEGLEELGLGILIWDGYRPVYAQQKLWDACPDPNFVSPPGTGRQTHCRGIAVDITLYDLETGELLEMPSDFDEFSALGDRDYSDCSVVARESALILENAMKNAGFQPYSGEWWHFSDNEDYPVETQFDPAGPQIWVPICDEFINLRTRPGGPVICQIPKGDSFQLLRWKDKHARVLYEGRIGWVSANYIMPADQWLEELLETVEVTALYSYQEMLADLQTLAAQYPDLVTLDRAGYSDWGTEIPVMRIGSLDAPHHVLMHGGLHGREHATTWLLMAMAETWLEEGGFEDLCLHIIPMVNPDGVLISQSGVLPDAVRWIYKNDWDMRYTFLGEAEYAAVWKANGSGVDINRNFPAAWDTVGSRNGPSSQRYRGSEPFSAAEAKALRDYTLLYDFDITISYHATGSITYYEFGDYAEINSQGLALAEEFQSVSGYTPTPSALTDGGGYKDWAISALGIPSLTVEIGCKETPLHQRELYSVFVRNIGMGQVLTQFLEAAE